MTRPGSSVRLLTLSLLTLLLTVTLSACSSAPYRCPETIPGPPGGEPIPVMMVFDDTGQPVADPGNPDTSWNAPAYACETDVNGNNIGDEYEVEVAEESMNAYEDD